MANFFSGSDIVGTAIEIERRGRNVYSKAAAAATNPDVKNFLQFFAGEEARHQAIFEAMAGRIGKIEIPAGSDEAEYMDYVQALLDSHALFCGGAPEKDLANAADPIEAIELASRFEKDTILYFREMMDLLPQNESDIVKQCLNEERGHLRQLRAMLVKLRNQA
ncbi:Rubrerythrin [Solidesulfovibrio fructosivorans JJ]]|uniref:Rubrerythrin n=1 Tax=Solidesulfovibrio fructosivorans JJ] TaxID=596151 RepID=E1JYD4_SOLFR|nr:ferritin family protein [Solidesulfovibrio fructosivorans]EFL50613.1 Rubrerythrin [Solidesulfovibrio fructosivorans JJ]]